MRWTIFLCFQFCMFGFSEPLLTSWFMEGSSTYAELFESAEDEDNHIEVHTWSHGAGNQSLPTYSGVNEVSYSDNWVYIRTTGLGHHIMGPWYRDELDTQLFGNFPCFQHLFLQTQPLLLRLAQVYHLFAFYFL